jgi:hypothetical protein
MFPSESGVPSESSESECSLSLHRGVRIGPARIFIPNVRPTVTYAGCVAKARSHSEHDANGSIIVVSFLRSCFIEIWSGLYRGRIDR